MSDRTASTTDTLSPRPGELVDGSEGEVAPEHRPVLLASLESSDRFRRDRGIGNIFHAGKISYREATIVDSLHIVIDGNRVSAHVDEISPLRRKRDGTFGYSPVRILAHNLSGIVADVSRRVRGRHGQQRCNLECAAVWMPDGASSRAGRPVCH
jgi:hypothetical protein